MIIGETIDALTAQHRRLQEILRGFDDGIWWNSDALAQLDVGRMSAQVDRIGVALDEIERLATEIGRPRTDLPF
ncbi:hypothetical protein AO398_00660 [Methylobacterium sp. GXS13]|uniref:hypothetical protein n=1 Tax=Methylobacterium sp. GXS13 TaxID=1730094 RepID=UPI00071B265C|nr:hypothetical protein [Methylobacterium sp. GXS13]KST61230.1 hypothetical protein AO398_00660 [Methylobacterium sp. GXS13]